jgi:DNA primase
MIPPDFVQTLLNRVDIVDVVDHHVKLKKAGSNYVACCPFHQEKTPSFTVSQTKQFYHCFGCGAHGTAVGFLMEYAGLPFVEAIKQLAADAGLEVPEQRALSTETKQDEPGLAPVLGTALRFYREQLKQTSEAIEYLKARGVSGPIAARFAIGYAPADWQNLAGAFPDYGAKSLVTAGLVIEGDAGKRYDRFRDRIMFPIFSQRGEAIGFGGRVLGQGEPKYLNSPETPIFEKGRELYGLSQAMRAIREAGQVVVVEGYMDVVALAQHGVEYAVATLGTATSAIHVKRLLRLANRVIFCFDGDAAGRRAAWRALEVSLPYLSDGKELAFLLLPQGEDPDSFIRKEGRERFERLLGEATPLSTYLLDELRGNAGLRSEEERAAFLQKAKPLIKQIAAPALSLMLRKRCAEIAGIAQGELDRLMEIRSFSRSAAPVPARRMQAPSTVLHLIAQILSTPELAQRFSLELPPERDSESQALAELVDFCRAQPQVQAMGPIAEHFRGASFAAHLAEAVQLALKRYELLDPFEIEAEFQGALAKFRVQLKKHAFDSVLQRIKDEGPTEENKRAVKNAHPGAEQKAP